HILVTHTHVDHSPASRLLKQRSGAPIFAFAPHSKHSAGALEGGVDREFEPDFELEDEEIISGSDWELEAIHTPGHCANHLCFGMPAADALFCGDHLMAWATTVILPPDGSVRDYLNSLGRLEKRSEAVFYPTHGAPITRPSIYIEQIRNHRLARAEQVEAALESGLQSLAQLRQRIYPELPRPLFGGAELSILGSINYLAELGKLDQGSVPWTYPEADNDHEQMAVDTSATSGGGEGNQTSSGTSLTHSDLSLKRN
ncbi:MAG: MBL fold metallo-hydrolase, partial [bacterium]